MRLHKISLLNLNSLYGEQSLDLERDLNGASLFLIHGRTGSGKSTVIDAVSLALFGKTPRLDAQRNATGADPCGIMSRGTGECRAEVEFSRLFADRSRVRYRAIWSVRRARKRADGSLQPVERSLERLGSSGEWELLASGRKMAQFNEALNEVLEGFTVDDFHRSMLLAQGRFDELLGANPEHRASILERLTNTAEYATIGSNAAEVARAHNRNIDFLSRQLGDTTPVTEEEFCEVSDAAIAAQEQTALRTAELNDCRSILHWWTERRRLLGELEQLEGEKQALDGRAEQLAPASTKFVEHTRCIAGFGALDRLEDLDRKVDESTAEINRSGALLIEAAELSEKSILQRDSDEQAAKLSEELLNGIQIRHTAHIAATDAADAAKQLLAVFHEEFANAQSDFAERAKRVVQTAADLAIANQDASQARSALEGCHRTRLVRERWRTQWQEVCISVENQERNLQHTMLALASREQQLSDALGEAQVRQQQHAEHRATLLEQPEFNAAKWQARLVELTGTADPKSRIRELRDAVERKRSEVEIMQSAHWELLNEEALQADLQQVNTQLVAAEQTAAARATEAARAREAANHAALRATDAGKHVHRLELVVEISRRREALSQGDECPLCGSVEHPYLDDPASCPDETIILQALADARVEHELLEKAAREADRLALETGKAADKYKHERDTRQAACSDIAARIQSRTDAILKARIIARLPEHCQSGECARRITGQTLQLEGLRSALKDLDQAAEAADAAQRQLAEARLAMQEQEESLKTEHISLEEQKKTLKEQNVELDKDRQDVEARRATLRTALQQAGENLLPEFEADTAEDTDLVVWRRRVEAQIARLDEAERLSEKAELKLRDAQKQKENDGQSLTQAQERLGRAKTQQSDQIARCGELSDRAEELLNEIRGLWATRPHDNPIDQALPEVNTPPEILARARRRAESLRQAAQTSRQVWEAAIHQELQLHGTLSALNVANTELKINQSAARQDFLAILAHLGFETAEQLRAQRMQLDELRDAQAKLDALERQQQDWKIRQQERRFALEKHELLIPAGFTIPSEATASTSEPFEVTLVAAVTEAEDRLKAANDKERECLLKLADAKRRMAQYASAREDLREAKKKASVWLSLDALIGTRNGDAFRQFAQGLNLHRLIQKANLHLERLSERYLLMQASSDAIPTLDFAIKDLWQGGEPRSTRTLSGGERFLVSLALALGLSDLRSQTLPIETLVLDEGFGTLDPDTLEVALAALQRLLGDGRQVGVISHVNGLKERIEAQVRIVEEGAGRSRIVVGR